LFDTAPCSARAIPRKTKTGLQKNNMKKTAAIITLAVSLTGLSAFAQDAGNPPPPEGDKQAAHGQGHGGGFHVLPPHAKEQLNLTPDQEKQIAALEADVKDKLSKILTPEQMEKLKQMRPHPPGGGPDGGPNHEHGGSAPDKGQQPPAPPAAN
jgi:Spy/CpxP family protein refolding chaperone